MLGCSCQGNSDGGALQMLPAQLAHAGTSELSFFVQGVRTGLAIRAAEQAKWTRLAVVMALTFGTITFLKHFNE